MEYTIFILLLRRFGGRDGNGEQGKEIPFHSVREKETVEHCEVDIRSIQYQLDADKYRQRVAAGEEPVDAGEKHDSPKLSDNIPCVHNQLYLAFTCNHQPTYDTRQQQDADCLEGKQITEFVTTQHRVSDSLDVDFQRYKIGSNEEFMFQRNEYYDDGTALRLHLDQPTVCYVLTW